MQAEGDENGEAERLPRFHTRTTGSRSYSFKLTPVTTENGGMG